MKDFKTLKVWQVAHELVLDVYRATAAFPKEEVYGLTSQMRRAAASVPANVAEGCGRQGDAEFARFVQIAMGSASELEYHLILARDLGLLDPETYQSLTDKVVSTKRMLGKLLGRLREPTRTTRDRANA
ncbi:MAG: four helix bundle protein [bacterium]|nr:four helix bundle protein [bacterium]